MKTILYTADSRGTADHGWLKTSFSFSFSEYHDPERMNFGMLRVLNDDQVAGGTGFGRHPHKNMEIVTIPLEGVVEHQDSTGGKGTISPGEVQVMSAGSGIFHSEYNHSATEVLKLLQIWVFPKLHNVTPRYDQRRFDPELEKNAFLTVASGETNGTGLFINQDAWFNLATLEPGNELTYKLHNPSNGAFIFVIEGAVTAAGTALNRRDALGISETDSVNITSDTGSRVLLIEVPMQ